MNGRNKETLPWAARYDPEVPASLSYPGEPLFELFRKTVRDRLDMTALIFFGRSVSYGELGRYVESMVAALRNAGVAPGNKVALLLPNCPQYVITYYGILMAGAVAVPVNPLSNETELIHIFQDAGVYAAVGLDMLAGRLEAAREKCRAQNRHLLEHV